jgi:hypothetical protein
MSKLADVITGIHIGPRRLMIYGTAGVGKSSFASCAPNAIFIQTEDGLGDIDCNKFPLPKSFDDVLTALTSLYTEKHDYKTVVIDSLDWLERLIWGQVCLARQVSSIEDIGYGKGFTIALGYWREVLDALAALRKERGMTVILVAHARIERFENPETEPYDRYVPRLHKLAAAMVIEWCDEVLFASYKVFTVATDQGFNQKRVQGVGSGERVILTTERPSHIAKNRLSLPDEMPLEWHAVGEFIRDNIASLPEPVSNTTP